MPAPANSQWPLRRSAQRVQATRQILVRGQERCLGPSLLHQHRRRAHHVLPTQRPHQQAAAKYLNRRSRVLPRLTAGSTAGAAAMAGAGLPSPTLPSSSWRSSSGLTLSCGRPIRDSIEMTWLPPVGGVPLNIVRRGQPRAGAGAARQNWQEALPGMVGRVQEHECAEPPEQLWEISTGSERLILDWCCR